MNDTLIIRELGRQPYEPVWHAMQQFTDQRNEQTADELWVVEHDPVFTQGQAGKAEHILAPGDIPVIQVDRGGQVTYHGPGQLVIYFLLNIRRLNYGVVDTDKICSLGLRIRKGCSFHGLALNVNMDMEPFSRINPCGLSGIKMIQTKDLNGPASFSEAADAVIKHFTSSVSYSNILQQTGLAQDYVKAS
ncbi:MAG: lipoyl(octanoyl) transferase LipB [Idiomarina sp.]|nr:lipoyl(octanoyl) transferase LipB [Idiomarina sp.]